MAKYNKHSLIDRIQAFKERLPQNYTVLYNFHFKKEPVQRLRAVWNFRTLDEEIIENFEKLTTLKNNL